MWIGQAPGRTETLRALSLRDPEKRVQKDAHKKEITGGIAFSGDAGQRFITWLMDAGLTEEECRKNIYKTSVVKCYPDKWPPEQKMDRKPGVKEIRLCRHFLEEQIRLIKPKILIPMGKVAIQWFFPEKELADTVGIEKSWKEIPVVCFPHASNASNWWKDNVYKVENAKRLLNKLYTGDKNDGIRNNI
jgi:uracil-DNA glycosylase